MASGNIASQIVYRDYSDADDEQCKALEHRAMQGSQHPRLEIIMKTLFRAGFEHNVTFDAKAKQYGNYYIRVAENATTKTVLGVCCAVLKKVWLYGELEIAGYIFELRVDEAVQSQGIGKALTEQMEEWCLSKGATVLYLSVNGDNTKAKKLYCGRGYQVVSERKPVQFLLMSPVEERPDVTIEHVDLEEGLKLTEEAYARVDMSLESLRLLFETPLYEGTLVARSGASVAGLSLWNGSHFVGFRVTRFFLPVWCWRMRSVRGLFLAGLMYLSFRWTCNLQANLQQVWEDGDLGISALFAMKALVTLGVCLAVKKVWPVISFCAHKITSSNTKLRGRAFAFFTSGPAEKQEHERLLQALVTRAKNLGFKNDYAMLLANLDGKYEYRPIFGQSPFTTLFMLKRVGAGAEKAVSPLNPANFFDPRDI